MIRRPPISTRTDTLFPYTTLFRSRAVELDLAGLQTDIGIMPARLLSVLEATKTWLAQGGRDPSSLYDVFQAAEARKGARARLSQTPNGRDRRAEWATDEHVLSDVLHYRWGQVRTLLRSEEHTSELQSLMRISYAVFCLKKK